MKLLKIKATNGPNFWSIKRHNLIVMLLDLEKLEELPTNKISGFYDRLHNLLPSLYAHRCSEGIPGGFFNRVIEGTWMGHVIEHIALEIQSLAGMETGFGRTRQAAKEGQYHVVFSYLDEEAGRYAAEASVRIAQALVDSIEYNIQADIEELKAIWDSNKFGPSTSAVVDEAMERGIPYFRLNDQSYVQFGYGAKQKRIQATIASTTSNIAVEFAGDKEATKKLLKNANIPVADGDVVVDEASLREVIGQIGFPIVLKPIDGNHGKGATTNIENIEEALKALKLAQQYSTEVICEKFAVGYDFRILLVNYKMIAAAKRTPAAVVGDGKSTLSQLIEKENKNPKRGDGHQNVLSTIKIDNQTEQILSKKGLNLLYVPSLGEEILLKPTANISTGGTATDVTDFVHPANKALFERAARTINLDICGIDVIASDLSIPIKESGGVILEINAAPGLRMHLEPTEGAPRNVGKPIVDMLFPQDDNGRIPIVAVTGTNGKTTTTRLVAHIAKIAQYNVGYTTTDGIYIQDELVTEGDCSGPVSARVVLQDSGVDFAVLETARGGILRSGLAFDSCDIAIITNIAEDHLGLEGIDTIEKLTRVKSVVAEAAKNEGYVILNADDDHCFSIKENVSANIALFSMSPENERVKEHCLNGGTAAVLYRGDITIFQGSEVITIVEAQSIPITFEGKCEFNIANVLAASLAGFLQGIKVDIIKKALLGFVPSPASTPGRVNIFDFKNFSVIVDYVHNVHGMKAMHKFVEQLDSSKKVGVISGVGDRRDKDIISMGQEAAKVFDEIIIKQDRDLRGRKEDELVNLLTQGIHNIEPSMNPIVFRHEKDSVEYAIKNAEEKSVILVSADNISEVLNVVQQLKSEEIAD